MTPEKQAHIMSLVEAYVGDYARATTENLYGTSKGYTKQCFEAANESRAKIEAALRDAPEAEPVAWHVNFRGSSHLLTSLESVDLTDCIVTPLYPEPRAPDNTLKDRLLAALERAAGAESALRRLADKTEPLTQTRGYHALVQVIYELQQDGNYSDEEGEETSALVELLRAIEATPSAPTAVEPDEHGSTTEAAVFAEWAGEKGHDTACTYDTERSRWVFLNPMTADLWKAWRASKGITS